MTKRAASVGRNPEGQDRETGLGRNDEHAVGATSAETPNPGSTPETGLEPGSYFEAMKAAADEIARLKASETGLVEALKRIDEQLWATHGSNNVEALIACLKSVENIVRDSLSNVSRLED